MYWIQLVALHWLADLPHSSDSALTLLDGAWTSLQALYMAAEKGQTPSLEEGTGIASHESCPGVTHSVAQPTA